MNKGLSQVEKIPRRELRKPKEHNIEKLEAHIATYNKSTHNYSQKWF